MAKRQAYTREFNLQAVRLLNEGAKKSTDLARKKGQTRILEAEMASRRHCK